MQPSDYVAASDGTGEAVRAFVTTERLPGAMTLLVHSVENWSNKFIATSGTLDIATGLIDEDTMTVFKGTLTGSIITIDEFAPGYVDVGHEVGQVVVLKPSTLWADTVRAYLDELSDFAEASTQVALVKNEVIGGTKDGVNTAFTLAGEAVTGTVELYKNGVRQAPGAGNDYTVAGQTITMAVAPLAGTVLLADYATSTSQFTTGTIGFVTNQVPTGLVNSSNTTYTCGNSYVAGTLEVWVNGLKQLPITHYTETTPASGVFTMGDAPLTGDNIMVNYQHTLSAGIGDADTVDGFHANAVATANTILPLNGSGKFPATTIPDLSANNEAWRQIGSAGQPAFQNGWLHYNLADVWSAGAFYKDIIGVVHLKGLVKSGTAASAIFTLPVGYRPVQSTHGATLCDTGYATFHIYANGEVRHRTGTTGWISLDHITFRADQ